jgi:AcrR family transcriptional regulator
MVLNASSSAVKRGLRGEIAQVYRRTILDAAERVFGRRGFGAAKMADIAREAGLAAGTLYNYFESKEEIVRALIVQRGDEFIARMEALAAEPGGLEEVLGHIVRGVLDHFEAHRALFAVLAEPGAGPAFGHRQGACAEQCHARYLRLFEALLRRAAGRGEIRRDLPVRDLAVLLTGSLHALVRQALFGGRKGPPSDGGRLLARVFLDGARAR